MRNIKRNSSTSNSFDSYSMAKHECERQEQTYSNLLNDVKDIEEHIEVLNVKLHSLRDNYAKEGGIGLNDWKELNAALLREDSERENINRWLKDMANNYLPFILLDSQLSDLLCCLEEEQEHRKNELVCNTFDDSSFAGSISAFLKEQNINSIDRPCSAEPKRVREYIEKRFKKGFSQFIVAHYQTMKEYDRFEKGAANSNTSTAVLKRQLEDPSARIIITTIQKLSTFIKKNAGHAVADKQVVIIFDECHRSQFGDMHLEITRFFKQYYLFGFTGTPIFAVNAGLSKNPTLRTTAQAFGMQLHTYTIVDAINDKNVLPFRIDYIKTIDKEPDIDDKEVWDIDRERAYLAPKRISEVVKYILDHFDQKTKRGEGAYQFRQLVNVSEVARAKGGSGVEEIRNKTHIKGFNSILAVSSVEAAKLYYTEFKKQMAECPQKAIKVATIFSFAANEGEVDGMLDEENSDTTAGLDVSSRDFLEGAIKEYNEYFGTAYDTSSEKFPNYYKDVSLRMKNKDIDLLIVVNMFLTGFDATTLNTLWVDKNLKMHGLIQAYSRTNRILNSIKTFGNVVCFRNLQQRTDDAIALFGDRDAGGIVLMRGFKDYYQGYKDAKGNYHPGYVDMIDELTTKFPVTMGRIEGETLQKEFIVLFGAILRMRNLLTSFDDFAENEILSERDLQDYLGRYQDLRDEWKRRKTQGEKEDITDDVVFELELVKQIEINIDYILLLVKKYHDSHCDDKEVLITIHKAIDASPELRSKKALIDSFIDGINEVSDVMGEWHEYVAKEKERQLNEIIKEENLKPEETYKYVENSFRDGGIKTTGTDIDKIMPPVSRFGGGREKKKQSIIEKLKAFFERFFGIG